MQSFIRLIKKNTVNFLKKKQVFIKQKLNVLAF